MEVKQSKNFKSFCKSDIFVYALLLMAISLLFLFFIIIPAFADENQSVGFVVEQDGKTLLTYTYSNKKIDVEKEFLSSVKVEQTQNGFTITIYSDKEQTEYNILSVDNNSHTVKMANTNCRSKQCAYMHGISERGVIYCAPRALKISAIEGGRFTPAITG